MADFTKVYFSSLHLLQVMIARSSRTYCGIDKMPCTYYLLILYYCR